MILQKGTPSLSVREFRWSGFGHVSLDSPFRNSDAKLQQFAAYSFRTPEDIFCGHAANECDDLRVNPRDTAHGILRFPTPEEPKSLAVPTKYRVGLHEQQCVPPMGQKASKQDNKTTLMGLENGTSDLFRCDDELLAK
jgi:hypothetical protein